MNYNSKDIELFKVYGEIIVEILRDTSFEDYERTLQNIAHNVPFEYHIWDYFKEHESTFKIFTLRYLEILELDGDVSKTLLKNNQYKKFINGLKKKKVGRVKDESILDSKDKLYYQRQNQFMSIIKEKLLRRHQNSNCEYFYVTVDDVKKFFSGELESRSPSGNDLYSNFRNENGDYIDFNLTKDSIAKYLNNCSRFFIKKKIRFYKKRLIIYSLVN